MCNTRNKFTQALIVIIFQKCKFLITIDDLLYKYPIIFPLNFQEKFEFFIYFNK